MHEAVSEQQSGTRPRKPTRSCSRNGASARRRLVKVLSRHRLTAGTGSVRSANDSTACSPPVSASAAHKLPQDPHHSLINQLRPLKEKHSIIAAHGSGHGTFQGAPIDEKQRKSPISTRQPWILPRGATRTMRHHATTAGLLGSGYFALLRIAGLQLVPALASYSTIHFGSSRFGHGLALEKGSGVRQVRLVSFNFSLAFVLGPGLETINSRWLDFLLEVSIFVSPSQLQLVQYPSRRRLFYGLHHHMIKR
ncbi:uncharacterized protein TrAFT101_011803 [Trichoderma asperellum]|uniref:uncharacterized protein n=1 Tax=Trichoderma asperellum TaxID=101201 RepID=UPI0033255009|nr:hypothetical protein TrAFT101_011803 [Trichoderma asperellum]